MVAGGTEVSPLRVVRWCYSAVMRALAIAAVLAGCGDPRIEPCTIACEPATGCPTGFTCSWGRCAAAGDSCTACEASAAGQTPCIEAIDAGGFHTCAIDACHQVWCWGANDSGQLGFTAPNGTASHPDALALPVSGVALGHSDSCAVAYGDGYCWGYDHEMQLGLPHATLAPTKNGVTGVETIAAGQHHTCALMHDRSVWCWGANDSGQLGIAGVNVTTMTPVHAFDGATAIAAGEFHTCAIRDGAVYCWGDNPFGQVDATGLHVGGQHVFAPTLVAGLHDVVELALGETVSCARRGDGTVACWGDNT